MTRREHCDQEELAALYALHALEPDEELRFAEHLAGCRRCREVLAAAERTATQLGESVPQHQPPARLRSALLDAVATTPQESQQAAEEPVAPGDAEPRGPVPAARGRRRTARALLAVAAAVAVGAVIALGVRVGQLGNERDLQAERSAEMSKVMQQAEQPGSRTAMLKPADGAKATAMVVARGSSATLMTMKLQPNADENTYVMWGLDGAAEPVAVGRFDVRPDQRAMHQLQLPRSARDLDGYAISIEPGHAPPDQPSHIVAKGKIAG